MRKMIWKIALSVLCFLCCYPIVFLVVGSFMGKSELTELFAAFLGSGKEYAGFHLLPQEPTLRAWIEVLLDTPGFFVTFWNSVKVTVGILLGQLVFALPGAWGFAKYKFPLRRQLFFLYIILMMLPFQVLMLSNYLALQKMHLLDTMWALILPGTFSTFPVFIMYNSFCGISDEVLEAARMDGASEMDLFLKIGIPIGKSGIFSALVLSFLECWNLVEQPMSFLKNKSLWPMSVFLPAIESENAGIAFGASVLSLIPALLVFGVGQEYLEQGIGYMSGKE